MKYIFLALGLLCNIAATAQKAVVYDVAITNVQIIDVVTGSIQPGNIGLRANAIAYTGTQKIKGKQTINGKGGYAMSALYDMHVHYPTSNTQLFFDLCLAHGITNIRMMNSEPEALRFREANRNSIPNLYIAYPVREDTIITDFTAFVQRTAGYDFIKTFSLKDGNYFAPLMQAAAAANKTVCGHALGNVNPFALIASGYKSIEHVGYFDRATPTRIDSLLAAARQSDIYFCPTLDWELKAYHAFNKDTLPFTRPDYLGNRLYKTLWDSLYATAHNSFGANLRQYQQYASNMHDKKIGILTKMFAAGLRIIAGSDAEEPYQLPGQSLFNELYLIKETGVSNLAILQTATTNPARYFNTPANAQLQVGSPANIILLQKNPIADLYHLETITHTIMRGKVYEKNKVLAKWLSNK